MKSKNKVNSIIVLLILIVLALFFTYMYVYNEDNVYVYDYIGYHIRLNEISTILRSNIFSFIKNISLSIRTQDYNYFPILLLIPFQLLFGNSRIVYEMSMTILFYVPLISITIYTFFKKTKLLHSNNKILKITLIIFVFCFTSFWAAMLRGLPDIIGTIPMILLILNFDSYNKKIPLKNLIINGVLIYLPFLCRRWYAYSMVSTYVAIVLISALCMKKINKNNVLLLIKNIIVSGIVTTICVVVLQTPLFLRIINTSYNNAYSAYQVSIYNHIQNIFDEYGLFIIILAIIGIIYGVRNFKKSNCNICIFSGINILVFTFLFTRVQMIGVHHFLGISLYVCLLGLYGIYYIYNLINKRWKILFLLIIILFSVINFSTTFIFRDKSIPLISQNHKYYKFRYKNYEQLLLFRNDLSNLISTNYGKVSFFATSENLSDSLIDTLSDDSLKSNIYYTSNIDKRDGLNFNSLLYKYVVITSKPDIVPNIKEQQVLAYPNNLIYNKEGIGNNYKKVLGPYLLQNGVEAFVYEKTENFVPNDINNYLSYFYNLYPEWEKEFSDFDKLILSSKINYGDKLGDFRRIDKDTYYIHPGYTPTEVDIVYNDYAYKELYLKFYLDNTVPNDTKTKVKILNNDKNIFEEEILLDSSKETIVKLKNKNKISIIVDYGDDFAYDRIYMDYEFK